MKRENTAVSVLMLTYNRENLVARAIESILAQTFGDFEFVIVDNGSTDRSGQIADQYATKDPRIHVIHRERGSISAGRNTALDEAKGTYLTFIDDDDWAEPDFLAFLVDLIQTEHADVAICGASDRAFAEKKVMNAEEALIELMWRKRYNAAFPTKLFRRNLFEDLRFPEENRFDDIALMYRVLAEAGTVAYHGIPKYTFYRHPGNHSAWTTDYRQLTPETLAEYLNVYRARTEWLSRRFPGSKTAFQYFEWSFLLSMVEKIDRFGLEDCRDYQKTMLTTLRQAKETFLVSPYLLEFEKEWMAQYIT